MSCRVCRHWQGDRDDWNEEGKPKVVGPCRRDPVPIETASTYECASISVDPSDARSWLLNARYNWNSYIKTKEELQATTATLERVRARVRNLKKRSTP